MKRLLAFDPGNEQTAWVVWDYRKQKIVRFGLEPNDVVLTRILHGDFDDCRRFACEMIASYGMAVGRTVFETCVFVGAALQTWTLVTGKPCGRVYRQEVKLEVCKSPKANDSNIRAALIDMLGPPGRKATPGPTFGVSKDVWAALGVAVTAGAKIRAKKRRKT